MSAPSKYIVITSIFAPSKAVKRFSKIPGWQLIVVGDRKTPQDWKLDNVIYLGPEAQEQLDYEIVKRLPWNHYCRKMVGYLYAISHGAEFIADTDDDNEPYDNWPDVPPNEKDFKTLSGVKFINIYRYYTDQFIWPRGLPLDYVLNNDMAREDKKTQDVAIWQFLANGDPDVDAIYRLTINKSVEFNDSGPIVLDSGTVCPFNSQNTIFHKSVFPLMFLPAFVTFRFTDILRGLVAQPLLWSHNKRLGFGSATVFQARNAHDYLKDFESEVPVYLNSEKVVDTVNGSLLDEHVGDLSKNLVSAYQRLCDQDIVTDKEVELLNAWITDLHNLAS